MNQYHVTLADLIHIADVAAELDTARQFYVDRPDEQQRLAVMVQRMNDIVERAAGEQSGEIHAPDDGSGWTCQTSDIVAALRDRAARKWTDVANRSASLFGRAADEIERLRKIEAAALNLVSVKGRHHTEQAYKALAQAL